MNNDELRDFLAQQIAMQYATGMLFEKSGNMQRAYFCYGKSAMSIILLEQLGYAIMRSELRDTINQLKKIYGME